MSTDEVSPSSSSPRAAIPALRLPSSSEAVHGASSPGSGDVHHMRMPVSPSPRLPPLPHVTPSLDKGEKSRSTSGVVPKTRSSNRHIHTSGHSSDANGHSRRRSGSHHHKEKGSRDRKEEGDGGASDGAGGSSSHRSARSHSNAAVSSHKSSDTLSVDDESVEFGSASVGGPVRKHRKGLPKVSSTPTLPMSPSTFAGTSSEQVLARSAVPYSEVFPVRDTAVVGPKHFQKLKLLGRGGIGKVYLVLLRGTDRLYAMKQLTKEDIFSRNKIQRVMTEREILATASHPFIVTMYASFQTTHRLCFVMEYCAGGEFFRVLQRQPQKRLRESAARFYAAEVVLALEYLHHVGFIYRDLKPENILMRANGHIALTDFDLSKQAHAVSPRVVQQQLSLMDKMKHLALSKGSRASSALNLLDIVDSEPVLSVSTTSFVGTEEYISPEVVNGNAQSSAVDWWTLGILVYEMLCGTTPFKGSIADDTFSNIVKEKLHWPDDVHVSTECKSVVKKLLRRDADKRLGAENGASDIKRARWFAGINFPLIRNETPPIVPKTHDPHDLSQYRPLRDDEDDEAVPDDEGGGTRAGPFANFSIRRDSATLSRQDWIGEDSS